jgi:hypothetical protein
MHRYPRDGDEVYTDAVIDAQPRGCSIRRKTGYARGAACNAGRRIAVSRQLSATSRQAPGSPWQNAG